jgi:hypothetical protein
MNLLQNHSGKKFMKNILIFVCLNTPQKNTNKKILTSKTPHIEIVVKNTIGRMNHQLKKSHTKSNIG